MSNGSFFWHDYETFGIDPRRDRPSQFAGQRTTLELEPIGEPVSIFCRPPRDVLPSPVSVLITGITPQQAERDGVIESEFAARVQDELGLPGTCGAGYNSLRFDDEFTRHLLYRNFFDAYEREWKNGNSRWDLIDLARFCYALRPAGIEWPLREDGKPSFRLEDLARANRLAHARAHDALSDVEATIALARLLRVRQPRLFDFYFGLRRKQRAFELLDYVHQQPVLHVSSRYRAERGCLAMIVSLARHPSLPNGVIAYDLDSDPQALLDLPADEIADRLFSARADLPEGVERVALKTVHANKAPALAPLSVLRGVDTQRIGLDVERCLRHLDIVRGADGVVEKVRQVFTIAREAARPVDPDLSLYSGFPSDADRRLLQAVRGTPAGELATRAFTFTDTRYTELLFRFRARNYPTTLSADESERWSAHCRDKLGTQTEATTLTFDDYFATIAALRSDPATTSERHRLLDQLQDWGLQLRA